MQEVDGAHLRANTISVMSKVLLILGNRYHLIRVICLFFSLSVQRHSGAEASAHIPEVAQCCRGWSCWSTRSKWSQQNDCLSSKLTDTSLCKGYSTIFFLSRSFFSPLSCTQLLPTCVKYVVKQSWFNIKKPVIVFSDWPETMCVLFLVQDDLTGVDWRGLAKTALLGHYVSKRQDGLKWKQFSLQRLHKCVAL